MYKRTVRPVCNNTLAGSKKDWLVKYAPAIAVVSIAMPFILVMIGLLWKELMA
jgi:hypothetical protein